MLYHHTSSTMLHTASFIETRLQSYILPERTRRLSGLERMEQLLLACGSPEQKLHIIHIAWTSGKGSTCWMTAHCLRAHGFSVWLSMSPHILDISERRDMYNVHRREGWQHDIYTIVQRAAESIDKKKYWPPTYFELALCIAYCVFTMHHIEYAIIETWLWWRLDPSNAWSPRSKVCCITAIWYDHTEILGETLWKIAYEKASIVHYNQHCYRYRQHTEIDSSIQLTINTNRWTSHCITPSHRSADYWPGIHNNSNLSLSQHLVSHVIQRDHHHNLPLSIREALQHTPPCTGRYTTFQISGKTIIVDWAHNAQKITSLYQLFEETSPSDITTIFWCKKTKNVRDMIPVILKHSSCVMCTEFSFSTTYSASYSSGDVYRSCVDYHASHSAQWTLNHTIREQCGSPSIYTHIPRILCEPDLHRAFSFALTQPQNTIIITWSFFLVAESIHMLTSRQADANVLQSPLPQQ
jgi:folylpolyglutamate synthase/dihydrofolate synthase